MAGWNRAQIFITDGLFGWSEVYYDTTAVATPPPATALQGTYTKALDLVNLRQAMLANGASECPGAGCVAPYVSWLRISNTGSPRNSLFASATTLNYGGSPAAVSGTGMITKPLSAGAKAPDNPYSAMSLVFGLIGGGISKRSISGVPDGMICDQAWDQGYSWTKATGNFINYLVANGWGALQASKPQPPAAGTQIVTVDQDEFGHPIITLAVAIATPPCSTKLTVYNYVAMPGTPSINGTYRATPQTPATTTNTTFTLRKVFTPLQPLCMGNAIPYSPIVVGFLSGVIVGPTKKNRGRPTRLRRGRARVRR